MTLSKQAQRIGLMALIPLLILLPLLMPSAKAAPQDATWGGVEVRDITNLSAVYPDVEYDANGKIHIAWIEYGAADTDPSRVLYTNNVSGAWLRPFTVSSSGGRHGKHILALTVESNRVHVMYTTNTIAMAHRVLTLNGATPTNGAVTSLTGGGTSNKGYNPDMVVDTQGRVNMFYISNKSGVYKIFHRVWANGAFVGGERIVRNSDPIQKEPRAAATSDGKVHVVFNNNDEILRYSIFDGANWTNGPDVASGKQKLQSLTALGNNVVSVYSAQPGSTHNIYMKIRSTGGWSSGVLLSSGSSYDELPEVFASPYSGKVYALWISGASNSDILSREIDPVTGSAGAVSNLRGTNGLYPRGTGGNTSSVSAVWEDKGPGSYYNAVHVQGTVTGGGGGGSTPTPITPTATSTATPTNTPVPNVDFTPQRTSASPSTNSQIAVSLANIQGNPNELRYSLTPFLATDAAPAWGTFQAGFTLNAPASLGATCGVATIYVQARNTANGLASAVKTVSAVIDTAVQAAPYFQNPNLMGLRVPGGNPWAPLAGADDYTRSPKYYYRFGDESAGCAGLAAYRDSNGVNQIGAAQSFYARSADAPISGGADPGGLGSPEQTFVATLVITDKLGTAQNYQRTMYYDDDPPIVLPGGSLGLLGNTTAVSSSIVTLVFSATVTDDSYNLRTPVGQNYWGAWVLAVDPAVTTDPKPSDFAAHGQAIPINPGSNAIPYVKLNNGLTGGTTGQRRVYVAFLDGAGNFAGYTGADSFNGSLLASSAISLEAPASLLRIYVPLAQKQ